MLKLVLRRLLSVVPALVLVSFAATMLSLLIPGNAAITIAGGENASPALIEKITKQLGLDHPLLDQWWTWTIRALHGNFGNSLIDGEPVVGELAHRMQVSLQLLAFTALFIVLISSILGFSGGFWPGRAVGRVVQLVTSLGIAMPAFLLGIIGIVVFAVALGWLPASGYVPWSDDPLEWARHLILPAFTLAVLPGSVLARQLRGGIVETMSAPFVRTAWAKGGTPARVLMRHVLRNSAAPAVTVLGLQIGALFGGTLIVENIFSIPGVGTYLFTAIGFRDLPVIQGVLVLFVLAFMLINLLVDIVYGVLDPRVRA